MRKGKYLEIYKADSQFLNEKYLGEIKINVNYLALLSHVDNNYVYYFNGSELKKAKPRTKAERTKYQVKGLSKEVRKEYAKILRNIIQLIRHLFFGIQKIYTK